MARTMDETAREVAESYLASISGTGPPPIATVKADILEQTITVFEIENTMLPKGQKWPLPKAMLPNQIAIAILRLYKVRRIALGGMQVKKTYDTLAVYATDGYNEGTYVCDEEELESRIIEFNQCITPKEVEHVKRLIRLWAERTEANSDKNLVAMNNGIFDYDTKQLLPFSPEYVFTVKSHVDYNPAAVNPILHNPDDGTDWDIETWMSDLSDDPEIVHLLWCVIAAALRSNFPWDKAVWFYSESGSNGKGSLCKLIRGVLGDGAHTSIGLADFSKDFMLEELESVSAIITDENDVGVFVDKSADLKAIITGDLLQVNRKFKKAIVIRFRGLMVQCVNELPRFKDKSDSLYRRQLIIPFRKCFTGAERKYIKNDYLKRREVLEYVAYKALNLDFDKLPEPDSCVRLLSEYKQFNDPVRQFVDEMLPQCQWALVPFDFLFCLFKRWFMDSNPAGITPGKNTFLKDLRVALKGNDEWRAMESSEKALRADKYMTAAEPLIARYSLKEWFNPNYSGNDVEKICVCAQDKVYRGLVRK